ncbi:THAP domain-containing protein [Phthorimaea operculella]|nr:THAP domain-containing protein [Phthorimaea operculella]
MGVCCVDGCEADDKEDVTYFPVPIAPAQLRKWRDAIKPSVKLHQDSKICSKHFHTSDYEKVRGKYRLKGRVVPSVFDKKKNTSPGDESEEDDPAMHMDVDMSDMLQTELHENVDDQGCTIECMPEAILPHEMGVTHRPKFVEISVDAGRSDVNAPGSEPATDDCMMLLENVQVDIDPTALMLAQQQDDSDDDVMDVTRKEDPISLLTSSDESDVILEEPHIDTVEVSSEDEDDKPLVALVKRKTKPTKLTRMLWGNLTEYYCYQCKFTTLSKTESERHKLEHSNSNNSKILFVCDVCNFTCASKSVFSKHKKRHKEEKRYKCKYCEYRARHSMSLVYHMKSHEEVSSIDVEDITMEEIQDKYKCSDCRFVTSSRKEIIRHAASCDRGQAKVKVRLTTHFCNLCKYSTKRKSDLKRHRERKHLNEFDDYD